MPFSLLRYADTACLLMSVPAYRPSSSFALHSDALKSAVTVECFLADLRYVAPITAVAFFWPAMPDLQCSHFACHILVITVAVVDGLDVSSLQCHMLAAAASDLHGTVRHLR